MARTITVKGIGEVSTRPDYVTLSMKLKAKDKEYDKAMDIAADQLSALNESLVSIGFERDAVKTTNFDVDTEYDRYKDQQGDYQYIFSGFVCSHKLKLSFDFDMKRLPQALSAIANCMAEPELRVAFTVKDPTAVNEALLREATKNARKKAEILCEASNVKLGQLLIIDYNWGELNIVSDTQFDMGNRCYSDLMTSKSMDIEPEDINVSDTAAFVWEIE